MTFSHSKDPYNLWIKHQRFLNFFDALRINVMITRILDTIRFLIMNKQINDALIQLNSAIQRRSVRELFYFLSLNCRKNIASTNGLVKISFLCAKRNRSRINPHNRSLRLRANLIQELMSTKYFFNLILREG